LAPAFRDSTLRPSATNDRRYNPGIVLVPRALITMKFASSALVVLCLVPFAAGAQAHEDKVRRIMEAQGLLGAFRDQLADGRALADQQGSRMLSQATSGLEPSAEFAARFEAAKADYVKAAASLWTERDIVAYWTEVYGSHFSDDELDAVLRWYQSPVGKKDTTVSQEAMPKLQAHFTELAKPILERETRTLSERLNKISAECRCRKP
jgi:hypothetical protein